MTFITGDIRVCAVVTLHDQTVRPPFRTAVPVPDNHATLLVPLPPPLSPRYYTFYDTGDIDDE